MVTCSIKTLCDSSPPKQPKSPIPVFAYFEHGRYNTRIYAYENNVLYGYSFPALYDRGFRSYLNLNWKPFTLITLYLKAGLTYYPDKSTISSSLTQVNDNKLFDLSFQIRIKL